MFCQEGKRSWYAWVWLFGAEFHDGLFLVKSHVGQTSSLCDFAALAGADSTNGEDGRWTGVEQSNGVLLDDKSRLLGQQWYRALATSRRSSTT
jgi:hypothetical protein